MFFDNIDLPGFVDRPALLVLATKNVDLDKNFITMNAPPAVTSQSFDEAKQTDYVVWRILPNPSDTWVFQMHRIDSGKLRARGNVLGIHTRNEEGEQARVRDDFAVARLAEFSGMTRTPRFPAKAGADLEDAHRLLPQPQQVLQKTVKVRGQHRPQATLVVDPEDLG